MFAREELVEIPLKLRWEFKAQSRRYWRAMRGFVAVMIPTDPS